MSASRPEQGPARSNAIHKLESRQVQSLFREINEQILTISDNPRLDGELELVCECANPGCFDVLRVQVADYEAVRRFPTRFIVSSMHAAGGDDRMVEDSPAFAVVEKSGPAAEAAIRLDPRRRLTSLPRRAP